MGISDTLLRSGVAPRPVWRLGGRDGPRRQAVKPGSNADAVCGDGGGGGQGAGGDTQAAVEAWVFQSGVGQPAGGEAEDAGPGRRGGCENDQRIGVVRVGPGVWVIALGASGLGSARAGYGHENSNIV